jgi:hypothetical protein
MVADQIVIAAHPQDQIIAALAKQCIIVRSTIDIVVTASRHDHVVTSTAFYIVLPPNGWRCRAGKSQGKLMKDVAIPRKGMGDVGNQT